MTKLSVGDLRYLFELDQRTISQPSVEISVPTSSLNLPINDAQLHFRKKVNETKETKNLTDLSLKEDVKYGRRDLDTFKVPLLPNKVIKEKD